MFYQKLTFPKVKDRPFFYTNFVQTIDGKVWVGKKGYWPIGSRKDYEVLTELRTYADCLIHGGNLAREFGEVTLKSINKSLFKQQRRVMGKGAQLPYYVVTRHPKDFKNLKANVFSKSLKELILELNDNGYKTVLIEGGPTLLGSFLNENLLDEIFLTIAPKIFGTEKDITLTLVEGVLFSPHKIKTLKLVSLKKINDEIFLRYRVNPLERSSQALLSGLLWDELY